MISDFGLPILDCRLRRKIHQTNSALEAVNSDCDNRKSKAKNRKWMGLFALLMTLVGTAAEAQQPNKIPRVGVLLTGSRTPAWNEVFRQALHELGYIEGRNIVIEYRSAEGKNDRQPELARELIKLKPDVLVSGGGNDVTRALMQSTKTIPIVMTAGSNPVGRGLISSLARPGGNVTGITANWDDLSGKQLELLRETIPKTSRIAVLWNSSGGRETQWKASRTAAKEMNLALYSMEIRTADDLEDAFKEALKARSGAVAVTQSSEVGANIQSVIKLAAKHRLPAIYAVPEYAEAGGLMAYGGSRSDLSRRAAIYVNKILKGANPAELPVEQPTKFELVINLKTAKQIGLTIPPNVLARADKVIK
jgi:putative tryptophan/tyrosine transport system substrate-binding protein